MENIFKTIPVFLRSGKLISCLKALREGLLLIDFEREDIRRYKDFGEEKVSPSKYNKAVLELKKQKQQIQDLVKKTKEKIKKKSDFDKWLLIKAEAKVLRREALRLHKYYSKGKYKKKLDYFVRKVLRRWKKYLFADGSDKVKVVCFDLKRDRLLLERFFEASWCKKYFLFKKWRKERELIKANAWE